MRSEVQTHMVQHGLSLRGFSKHVGISPSTLSRYLRGQEITAANERRLKAFFAGDECVKSDPVCVRRFRVGDKIFVVEIREEL